MAKNTGVGFGGVIIAGHDICPKMPLEELSTLFATLNRPYCSFCYEKVGPTEVTGHDKACKTRE